MNTVLLSQRLGEHLAVEDAANLDARAALDVLQAINSGFQRLYRLLPGIYKRTTLSHTFFAPQDTTVTFSEVPGRIVTGTPFSDRRGCTVRIAGTTNQIIDDSTVLDLYTGPDASPSATIYHDVAEINDVIQKITSDVRLTHGDNYVHRLQRDESLRTWASERAGVGRPQYYCIDAIGMSQGGEPAFFLRVWPMPDAICTVRMEAELATARIRFVDLKTARALPLADDLIEDCLIPLCLAHLTRSPRWANPATIRLFQADSDEVVNDRIPRVPADIGSSRNRASTPKGF